MLPSGSTNRKTGWKSHRANAITLQQIHVGNVDLFHPKMKKQTKTGQRQYKIDCYAGDYAVVHFSSDHALKVTVKVCKLQQ